MSDIVEKEERRSMRKAQSEVHAITRENFDVIRSDLSSTARTQSSLILPEKRRPFVEGQESISPCRDCAEVRSIYIAKSPV